MEPKPPSKSPVPPAAPVKGKFTMAASAPSRGLSSRDKGLIALAAFVVIGLAAVVWDLASGPDAQQAADAGFVDPQVASNESLIAGVPDPSDGLTASPGPSGSTLDGLTPAASASSTTAAPSAGTSSGLGASSSPAAPSSTATTSPTSSTSGSSTSSSSSTTSTTSSSTSTTTSSLPSLPSLPLPLPI